jgi:hypothetical protein
MGRQRIPALSLARVQPRQKFPRHLRGAYAHLLKNGVEIQRAANHVCQRSIHFADPDGNGLEIYYEMPRALELFPNGHSDEDESAAVEQRGRQAAPVARRRVARPRRDGQSRTAAPPTGTTGG